MLTTLTSAMVGNVDQSYGMEWDGMRRDGMRCRGFLVGRWRVWFRFWFRTEEQTEVEFALVWSALLVDPEGRVRYGTVRYTAVHYGVVGCGCCGWVRYMARVLLCDMD
mmetsp:Transcript_7175/g.20834  ORF Transcript_7175/g.20834 Transcript_7175/m.20834 type:complete len:108 (+) Transcript_7175:585-908(+)